MIFVLLLSLCAGGLVAWTITIRRWLRRLPAYPPEPRLVSTWGFAEFLLCLGVYILFTGLAGMALLRAGFHLSPEESASDVAAVVSGTPGELGEPGELAPTVRQKDPESADMDAAAQPEAEDKAADDNAADDKAADDKAAKDNTAEDNTAVDNAADATKLRQARERTGALIAADGMARLLTIAVVLTMLGVSDRLILRRFGLIPRARDIAIGLVASCMLLPPVFAMQAALTHWVPYEHKVLELLTEAPPAWVLVSMAFTSMIVAPVAEEFFFRGLLQGWFQRLAGSRGNAAASRSVTDDAQPTDYTADSPYRSPGESDAADDPARLVSGDQVQQWPWWPVIASSLIFALAHFGQGAAPVVLFFLALGLGYLYRVTGRLWPSITVHFVLNSISTLMTIFAS
ncbi:CPBP family intramembrane glutamic endopeptidase [Roseimaritima sediminicola]|uniref:CPBP family intramembrane glutamic endopeptidase n=1 Tax=Roseimaritima sediminicola TaxID=2662066 RepID=UPI0013872C46|nr:CPBP family intramembrane glutamic endopeptidase [Roseimaritima sediminicola]